MPRKRLDLILHDLKLYAAGGRSVELAELSRDEWLYPLDFDFAQLERQDFFSLTDNNGVPMKLFPPPIGVRYLPSRIANFAFGHWNRYRRGGSDTDRRNFLIGANWFASQAGGLFRHDFDLIGMRPPWLSCLAQGEGISVLVRAFVLTDERTYLEQAHRAVAPLLTPVAEGGVLGTLPDGGPFLEEYPGSKHCHVLNGCLYAMIGLHDISRVADVPTVPDLFDALTGAITRNIHAWEQGGWSLYQYAGADGAHVNYNTVGYHSVHIAQLTYLAGITGCATLAAAANRLEQTMRSPWRRGTALVQKIRYRAVEGW